MKVFKSLTLVMMLLGVACSQEEKFLEKVQGKRLTLNQALIAEFSETGEELVQQNQILTLSEIADANTARYVSKLTNDDGVALGVSVYTKDGLNATLSDGTETMRNLQLQ